MAGGAKMRSIKGEDATVPLQEAPMGDKRSKAHIDPGDQADQG